MLSAKMMLLRSPRTEAGGPVSGKAPVFRRAQGAALGWNSHASMPTARSGGHAGPRDRIGITVLPDTATDPVRHVPGHLPVARLLRSRVVEARTDTRAHQWGEGRWERRREL